VAEIEKGAGFVYSDFIQLKTDGSCPVFGPKWGWESYRADVAGKTYDVVRAFDPTPSSLMHIWWAPNHVRAWSRAAYEQTGGYDAGLKVCDDIDLVVRTYISGAKFAHVAAPLYFYRLRSGKVQNTHLEHNAEIQRLDQEISNRHFYKMVDEWCRRENLARVDVKVPGRKLDLPDGTAGAIKAHDVLHRIHHEYIPTVMNDFYRALAPGGWLMIRVPCSESMLAFADPTARSYWNRCSWWFYTRAAYAARVPDLAVRFQESRSWDAPANEWDKAQKQLSSYADLCALKGQRQPGLKHI
jgi:O-antigen biosynthesis protein